MMRHEEKTLSGRVTDVFAHRFVVETANGKVLADLTPKGAEGFRLKAGDHVEIAGEMKPSEIKVRSIARNGAAPVVIDHPPKPPHPARHHPHEPADPSAALRTVRAKGFVVLGEPRRRPKHFEILGRDAAGKLAELHIELDGAFRKMRPLHGGDPKWAMELVADS